MVPRRWIYKSRNRLILVIWLDRLQLGEAYPFQEAVLKYILEFTWRKVVKMYGGKLSKGMDSELVEASEESCWRENINMKYGFVNESILSKLEINKNCYIWWKICQTVNFNFSLLHIGEGVSKWRSRYSTRKMIQQDLFSQLMLGHEKWKQNTKKSCWKKMLI